MYNLRKVTKGKLGDLTFQLNPTTINYAGGGWTWNDIPSPGMLNVMTQKGAGKPFTIQFELYVNERMQPLHKFPRPKFSVNDFTIKLNSYRDSSTTVLLAMGSKVYKVVVTEFSYVGVSFNSDFNIYESTFNCTFRVVK